MKLSARGRLSRPDVIGSSFNCVSITDSGKRDKELIFVVVFINVTKDGASLVLQED